MNLINKIKQFFGFNSDTESLVHIKGVNLHNELNLNENSPYTRPEDLYVYENELSCDLPRINYVNGFNPDNPTVLIMDDYEGMVNLIVDELLAHTKSINANILTSSSPYAAFAVKEYLKNENHHKIDIAFLDITIGGVCFDNNTIIELDGIDIAELIWKENPQAEIRFITGHTLSKDNHEMHSFIKKFEAIRKNLVIEQCQDLSFNSTFRYRSRIKGDMIDRVSYNYVIHKSVNRLELMLHTIHTWYKRVKSIEILGFK